MCTEALSVIVQPDAAAVEFRIPYPEQSTRRIWRLHPPTPSDADIHIIGSPPKVYVIQSEQTIFAQQHSTQQEHQAFESPP